MNGRAADRGIVRVEPVAPDWPDRATRRARVRKDHAVVAAVGARRHLPDVFGPGARRAVEALSGREPDDLEAAAPSIPGRRDDAVSVHPQVPGTTGPDRDLDRPSLGGRDRSGMNGRAADRRVVSVDQVTPDLAGRSARGAVVV